MYLGNSSMLFWVALVLISWTFCHGSDEIVSVLMEKRASFDNKLPLTSACYISEIENTSRLRCFSQCVSHLDVCNGIVFNQESQACKLIKCNPADLSSGQSVAIGSWDLFWNTCGTHIFLQIANYMSIFFGFYLSMKHYQFFRIMVCKKKCHFYFFFNLFKYRPIIYDFHFYL